jgi:hypothetical protein
MGDNAEEGIMRAQLAAKDGVGQHQERSASNLGDRIFTSLFALGFVGLMVVWASATSPYLKYGSLVAGIIGVILFGVLRVRRIERVRNARERQVREMQSGSSD